MKSLKDYIFESNKFNVYIMCGLPGSGKSTWVKETHPEAEIVSRDIIRAELGFTKDVDEKAVLTKEQEEQVTQKEHELIKRYSNKKKSFAVDDLNTGRYRKDLIRTLKRYGAHVIGVNVKTPIETCIERRKGQISADVIRKIADNMQFITRDEIDEVVNVEK
jgi:predicted kinase